MKKNIQEQDIKAQKTSDGKVNINGYKYRLEVKKPLVGWMQVNIDELTSIPSGWKVTASKMGVTQTDIVPSDTISVINKNIGQLQIDLGGKQPKRLVKEENMKKIIKLTETDLENLIKKVLKEQESPNYMFFSNLEQIKRQCELLLELDPNKIDDILMNGHDWADDHITVAKENIDQVFDFMMNETKRDNNDQEDMMTEGAKKTGTKLCSRGYNAAKAKFKVFPSAYSSGYGVQVCKGKIKGLDGKKHCSGTYC
jgi:hypothetical protein